MVMGAFFKNLFFKLGIVGIQSCIGHISVRCMHISLSALSNMAIQSLPLPLPPPANRYHRISA